MFGNCAHKPPLPTRKVHDFISYLQAKLAQLYSLVEVNNIQASRQQKEHFDCVTQSRTFTLGNRMWVSGPTAGKLDPKWEGGWVRQQKNKNSTYQLSEA